MPLEEGRDAPGRAVVLGCGFIGLRLAAALADAGWDTVGTTRGAEKIGAIMAVGATPAVVRLQDSDFLRRALGGASVVFLTVAAGRSGDYRETYVGGVNQVLQCLDPSARPHVVYTSATSVYGQNDGSWVDEDSPTEPETERGAILLEAERSLLEGAPRVGATGLVLRLSGLWGDDRDPANWMKRSPLSGDGTSYLNLIHRDDVVAALFAAGEQRTTGLLNLSNDEPMRRRDFYPALAAARGLPVPTFEREPASPDAAAGKRVRNARALKTLGLSLRFPRHPGQSG